MKRFLFGPAPDSMILILLAILLSPSGVEATPLQEEIMLGPEVAVTPPSGPSDQFVEPHAAVSPSGVVVTAAIVAHEPDLTSLGCAVFRTDDLAEWQAHDFGLSRCADPWLQWVDESTVLFVGLGPDSDLVVHRSFDAGLTWDTEPEVIRGAHDHPTMVADGRGGAFIVSGEGVQTRWGANRSALSVFRSPDGRAPFDVVGRSVASNLSYEAQVSVVLADTMLLVPFTDHRRLDGGRRLVQRRNWVQKWPLGGADPLPPILIGEACHQNGGPIAWGSLVANPANGDLFWVCEGEGWDGILVHASTDGGEVWADPERVTVDSSDEPAFTRTPMLAFDEAGIATLAWFDASGSSGGDPCYHLVARVSTDGLATFGSAVRLTSEPSCPSEEANGSAAARFPTGGDYHGLVSVGPGHFVAVWSGVRDGSFRLLSRSIRVSP
jgi:hypothetical protein